MNETRYKTITEFWPYYVNEHSKSQTRQLHFIGNTNLFLWLTFALLKRSILLVIFAVFSSYLIAWIGHFFVEKNMPATFKYPVMSAICDMRMYFKMMNGTMNAEVTRYVKPPGNTYLQCGNF